MKALLFLLLPLSAFAQHEPCFICLTEQEARQAADSALKGQSNGRRLEVYLLMNASRANEASLLREAMRVDTLADRQMMVAYEARTNEAKSWEKAYIGQKAKGTKKTVLWSVIGILMGAYLKTVL